MAVLRVVDLQNMPFLVISEFKEDVVLSLHNAIRGDYRTAEPKDVINTGLRVSDADSCISRETLMDDYPYRLSPGLCILEDQCSYLCSLIPFPIYSAAFYTLA